MKVEIQANGFKATGIQELIEVFEKAAAILSQTARLGTSITAISWTWQTSSLAMADTAGSISPRTASNLKDTSANRKTSTSSSK